ncbi:hypothetical protein DQ04_05121020 [Trypanosoma grayi]|uniref:hypothetical protein n=1 Tax=Trypanosoma grayi TaxID=71804 RepID=UPI0004F480EA|nr:hypothetical protein DQ04_05121020 [Trypanosoma grayi]KEG09494.1 hypothetical protein DQ04_05121020 [Trypanosoma grayi]
MLLRLAVYVDDAHSPIALEEAEVSVYNMPDLFLYLENTLRRRPRLISYWNVERERYELLTSLQCLVHHLGDDESLRGGDAGAVAVPAHLWVETRPPRLDPVDPEIDAEEYAELKDHVQRWAGNRFITYSLLNALRVTDPCKERLFDHERCTQVSGDPERVELLYYTNNSLSSSEVMQRGFDLGGENRRFSTPLKSPPGASGVSTEHKQQPLFVFASSMADKNDKEIFSTEPHKVLLCEVALGRAWPCDIPLARNPSAPPEGYDSVCYREERENGFMVKTVRVGKNHQALARYVLTLVGKKSDRRREAFRSVRFGSTPDANGSITSAPHASRRTSSASGRTSVLMKAPMAQEPLRRSGSAPIVSGGTGRREHSLLLPSAVTCVVHNGSLLGLWCSTCGHMICPYCASVGEHRRHEVSDVEVVADEVRRKVQEMCHDLSIQLDNYQRVQSQLQAEQVQLQQKRKEAVNAVETTISDLHTLLDAKKEEWLARIQQQTHCLDDPLVEVNRVVQEYENVIAPLEGSWDEASRRLTSLTEVTGHAPTTAASVAYLMEAPKLLEEGHRFVAQRHDAALDLAINAAKQLRASEATLFHIDSSAVRQSIEGLIPTNGVRAANASAMMAITGRSGRYTRLSTSVGRSATGKLNRRQALTPALVSSPSLLLESGGKIDEWSCDDYSDTALDPASRRLLLQRLSDLRKGYLWCVHDANKYFHPGQRQAVCSRAFKLLGVQWELRIQARDATSGSSTPPKQMTRNDVDEAVGIFLFPVGHTLRVDFRICIFSAVAWAEWKVSGWAASFVGKGWGVYPLLPRRELMQTDRLAWENTLKICIAPTSGVY